MTRILLVEDNQLNREMFSRRLERKGFEVITAGDGKEAIEKTESHSPDLILMDLSLPIMDGWEATRHLKASPSTATIPVIALTAHAMVGDREKALEAGCDDYDTKPVDLPNLLGKIAKLLPKRAPTSPEVSVSAQTPVPSSSFDKPLEAISPSTAEAVELGADVSGSLLVVDDNPMNREMLLRRLQREGYNVTIAASGSEAIEWLDQSNFDLVLLDMMMPEMSGLDILEVVRSRLSLHELPIIVVTAKDESEDMVQALQMGANDYVTKPFNFPVLLARIKTQLALTHKSQAPTPSRVSGSSSGGSSFVGQQRVFTTPGSNGSSSGYQAQSQPSPQQTAVAQPPSSHDDQGFSSGHPGDTVRVSSFGDPVISSVSGTAHKAEQGAIFADYEVLEELGRGGMGIVYKARHKRMNRLVALKVINKEHLARPSAITRFYREIEAAAQLSHRNIVLAYDAGEVNETHFFAMEYVEGIDLQQMVQERGPLPIEEACSYILQTARGLQHVFERGLVHRDIKPSNLLVTWDTPANMPAIERVLRPSFNPGRTTVKILDLGLALIYAGDDQQSSGLTRDGRVVGTADYMAPEQWMNAHKVDIRADLYSLGGTFYFLITGKVPFPGEEPMEKMLKHHLDEPVPVQDLVPGVPPRIAHVIQRLMSKSLDNRFQSPAEVLEALTG